MNYFKKYIPEVEKEIKILINQHFKKDNEFKNMINYSFGWVDKIGNKINEPKFKGKRFRPALCLFVCEAICDKYNQAIPIASAIEIFHNFSLVHDDIEDDDKFRRWRETNWKIFGIPQSINSGDAMLILTQLAIYRSTRFKINNNKILKLINILNLAFLQIVNGQYLDMSFEEKNIIELKDYLRMIKNKTAVLIGVSCEAGAILSTNKQNNINNFKEFGLNFGMAYQIYDDIHGIWAEFNKTGKKNGGDIIKKKKTLPIIYAFNKLDKSYKNKINIIYNKKRISQNDVKIIIRYLDLAGSYDYCNNIVLSYKNNAIKILDKINIKQSDKNHLIKMINKIC